MRSWLCAPCSLQQALWAAVTRSTQPSGKQGDGVESEDLHAVHGIPGKDVQGSSAAFHNLLHPHTILHEKSHWGIATVSLGSGHPLPGH